MMLLPIALLLSKCKYKRIAGYFYDIVANYRWAFFIRAWIEIYLELMVASYIQVLYPAFGNTFVAINTIVGFVFFAVLFSTPILVFIFLILNRKTIIEQEYSKSFSKFYGSLFLEFKNNKGLLSTNYYTWFFSRRVLYVTNLIILRKWPGL